MIKKIQIRIFIITALLVFFTTAEAASANCMWSLYNKCSDIDGGWVTAASESYCSGQKPNGTTAKCCCGPDDEGCCVKDRNGVITTDNLKQSECQNIDYAETTFLSNAVALVNKCYIYSPPYTFTDITPESNTASAVASTVVTDNNVQSLKFTPQVQIPVSGLDQKEIEVGKYDGSDNIKSDLLARYIKGIYDYGLMIAGILAALVLMGGGLLWLTSGGNDAKITQAKELIVGSVSGLVILFGSWVILNTINPALLELKPITTGIVAQRSYLNCCDPEAGLTSILVEVKNGKTIAREGDKAGQEVSCMSPSKSCGAGEACLDVNDKYDCRVDNVCCECVNYLGVGNVGLPVSFTCKNDLTVSDCKNWCDEWYTTGYTVEYYWGGSTNYSCGAILGFGNCSSK